MFFDFDKPLHSLRDYSSLPDIISDCNQKGMRKKQIVQTLCEKGCSKSTAYSYINKYNMTMNDMEMTLDTLRYLGIWLLKSY